MKSRRNFITKTGIATVGLIAIRPFKTFASSSVARRLGFGNNNKLVLLHTSPAKKHRQYAEEKISSLQNSNHNMVVLKQDEQPVQQPPYDIMYRGNQKIGIIRVAENSRISAINETAASLKKDQRCDMVVCFSALGYKKQGGTDDLTLAEKSSHIDFIIGNHATNHNPFPVVARNSNRCEVIIHHAANNGFGLGNIEVEFDENTNSKRSIGINNLLTRLSEKA